MLGERLPLRLLAAAAVALSASASAAQAQRMVDRFDHAVRTEPQMSDIADAAEPNRIRISGGFVDAGNRPRIWVHALWGAAIGGVAGAGFGTYVMATADDWVAPPGWAIFGPAGILVGASVGALVGVVRQQVAEDP